MKGLSLGRLVLPKLCLSCNKALHTFVFGSVDLSIWEAALRLRTEQAYLNNNKFERHKNF